MNDWLTRHGFECRSIKTNSMESFQHTMQYIMPTHHAIHPQPRQHKRMIAEPSTMLYKDFQHRRQTIIPRHHASGWRRQCKAIECGIPGEMWSSTDPWQADAVHACMPTGSAKHDFPICFEKVIHTVFESFVWFWIFHTVPAFLALLCLNQLLIIGLIVFMWWLYFLCENFPTFIKQNQN